MAVLFTPIKIGRMEVRNRFVRSATHENLASPKGEVTDELIKIHERLARGGVGLIIPGYAYIHEQGKGAALQNGIHNDEMIPGWRRLAESVHAHGAKIAVEIVHGGRQCDPKIIGTRPMGPSTGIIDPIYRARPRAMTEEEIWKTIENFGEAARRVKEAGCDAVQLHGAHGYLINQFLSPLMNRRSDQWGGSLENRMRFLIEVYRKTRKAVGKNFPVLIKLNVKDYTIRGFDIDEAVKVCERLVEEGIDAIEISVGTIFWSIFNMSRGEIPVEELGHGRNLLERVGMKILFKAVKHRFLFEEAYNLRFADRIKPRMDKIPLILVGGLRDPEGMEHLLKEVRVDLVSLSRPLIREPHFPRRVRLGDRRPATCASCNKCLGESARLNPLRCYNKIRITG